MYNISMNKLSIEKRTQVITALVEGNSIRATCRMTGTAKWTVIRLLTSVGAMKNFGLASGILLTLFSERATIPTSIMTVFFLSRTLWLGFHFKKPA